MPSTPVHRQVITRSHVYHPVAKRTWRESVFKLFTLYTPHNACTRVGGVWFSCGKELFKRNGNKLLLRRFSSRILLIRVAVWVAILSQITYTSPINLEMIMWMGVSRGWVDRWEKMKTRTKSNSNRVWNSFCRSQLAAEREHNWEDRKPQSMQTYAAPMKIEISRTLPSAAISRGPWPLATRRRWNSRSTPAALHAIVHVQRSHTTVYRMSRIGVCLFTEIVGQMVQMVDCIKTKQKKKRRWDSLSARTTVAIAPRITNRNRNEDVQNGNFPV